MNAMGDQVKCGNCYKAVIDTERTMIHGDRITVTFTCGKCGHMQKQTFNLEHVSTSAIHQ